MRRSLPALLSSLFISILVVGCITTIDESLPYTRLPEIRTATDVTLVASPSHPASYLSSESIPAGERLEVIGRDEDSAWLLVLHHNMLGWMPTIYSRDNVGNRNIPIVFEPLSDKCTKFVSTTDSANDLWISPFDGSVLILGIIYRPEVGDEFGDSSIEINIEGNGAATRSDYVHTPLTKSESIVLFAYSLTGIKKESQISFDLMNTGDEELLFQAVFFSDLCPEQTDASRLSIGETRIMTDTQSSTLISENAQESEDARMSSETAPPTRTPIVRTDAPTVPPTPLATFTPIVNSNSVQKWYVKSYNVDDAADVYINGERVLYTAKQRDSGWVDITDYILSNQENFIRFVATNFTDEYTWGFAIRGDDEVIWESEAGEVGFRGANNHDMSKESQVVYYRAFVIDGKNKLTELASSSTKWFVRLDKIDDSASLRVNDAARVNTQFSGGPGDSGWVEITDWIHDGHENKLEFTAWNTEGGGTYDLSLRRGGTSIWQKDGDTRDKGIVYDQILYIDQNGDISATPESTRWFVNIGYADDLNRIFLNGKEIMLRSFEENWDRPWLEITQMLRPSQDNVLRFTSWNESGPGKWSFSVMQNSSIVWEKSGTSEQRDQTVFDESLIITVDGELIPHQ